jgi:hypothetical protein
MKRFHFPLERVRQWREGQAALEELKLEQLLQNVAALERRKESVANERARSERQLLAQETLEGGELGNLDAYRLSSRDKIRDIENRKRQVLTQVEQQRQRVIGARRDAELLERLKQKAREAWQAASDCEEEALAGELYLARLTRHR